MCSLLRSAEYEFSHRWGNENKDYPFLGRALAYDSKVNFNFEGGFFDLLPTWYINSLTPHVHRIRRSNNDERHRYFSSAIELASNELVNFRYGFDLYNVEEFDYEFEELLELYELSHDEFAKRFLLNCEADAWEAELYDRASPIVRKAVDHYFNNQRDADDPSFDELSCLVEVEYSKFVTDHVDFVRDELNAQYPAGFYDFRTEHSAKLVTIEQIAIHVHLDRRSMGPYTRDWPHPVISHGGRRPAKYDYDTLLPTLQGQFPDTEWPKDPTDLRKKSDS